ncbi:ead/Ea22-like family protein [Salmonella enterica]|uniref:Ead/Ea22-like family protein n=2 Tax=Salmonella enterica TaxID=28901 RepID=A0A315H8J6_SALET|nr:ead/Ea22-like family protein [Salmonella enterica]EBP3690958.1 ead/Ea22-like family protein [Salmonella enterica subsp. enterica]EDQ9945323.1 ead/Ea22-like family protein [Salmonella enterica subsp. enterica serovar Gaminara]EAX3090224.1 ead/Ea22-like family protein [Salmonella enterica]EAY8178551.1 ead/Ea22-like family protein [Salmonella enterica]
MTIDKRALREVAEKATPGNWRRTSSLFNGITVTPFSLCGEEVTLAHTVEKRDAEFIAAANPTTMLALLDENLQLQREKDATEAVALALRDDMRQAREQLEAAEKRIADGSKRIAELESNEVREVGNKFLVVRHPGKTPAIKHCTGDLEDFLRKLIEQDPLVTIDIITHRYYGVGGQWVQDAGEYLQMMQGAGIGVKQQEDSVDSDVGRNQPGMVVAVHIGAGDFVKFKGQVFEVEETDFDDHDVTLWFVGGNALKCAAGCPVEVVSAPVAAGIKVKGE